jgi:hypothetical protein
MLKTTRRFFRMLALRYWLLISVGWVHEAFVTSSHQALSRNRAFRTAKRRQSKVVSSGTPGPRAGLGCSEAAWRQGVVARRPEASIRRSLASIQFSPEMGLDARWALGWRPWQARKPAYPHRAHHTHRKNDRTNVKSPILRIGTLKVSRRSPGVFSSNTNPMRAVMIGCWRASSSKL